MKTLRLNDIRAVSDHWIPHRLVSCNKQIQLIFSFLANGLGKIVPVPGHSIFQKKVKPWMKTVRLNNTYIISGQWISTIEIQVIVSFLAIGLG